MEINTADSDSRNGTVRKCVISSCGSFSESADTSDFHSFPSNRLMAKMWLEKCQLPNNMPLDQLRICPAHFLPSDFDVDFESAKKVLRGMVVPSQNLEGPEIFLKDIAQLQPAIIKEIVDNVQMKNKLSELQSSMTVLKSKILCYSRKLKLKERSLQVTKHKLSKVRTHSDHKDLLSKVFSDAQINILMRRKKVIWSDDDLAMAFSLRQLSSKQCYLYLKQTLNFPLPALSCVQKWAASK